MISNFNHLRDGVQPSKLITCMVQFFILHTHRHHGGHATNHAHWFNPLRVHMWCTTRMKPTCKLEELLCVWGQVSDAGWGVLPGDGHGTGVHTHIGCGGAGGGGGRGHLHVQVSQLVLPLRCNLLVALWLLLSWITVCPHREWTQSQDASVTCLPFSIVKKLKMSCGPVARENNVEESCLCKKSFKTWITKALIQLTCMPQLTCTYVRAPPPPTHRTSSLACTMK